MPFDTLSAATGVKRCPDETCRGHQLRRVSVELRLRVWTHRVGHNAPIQVSRTEKIPWTLPEDAAACEYCGKPNVVDGFRTGPDGVLRWPTPIITPTTVVDAVLPVNAPPTLEQRVEALEEAQATHAG